MLDILTDVNSFLENDIFIDDNFKKIIDNMIYTNYFDLTSTTAIYLQNRDTILAFSEWKINRIGNSIYDESNPIIVPIPSIELLFSRLDEWMNIALATEKEVEQILLKKIATKEKTNYFNVVFYDLLDTTCKDYDRFLNSNLYYVTEYTSLALKSLCEKFGITVIFDNLSALNHQSFFSFDESKLFLDNELENANSLFHTLNHLISYLIIKTSTQDTQTLAFENELSFYILCKKLCLNIAPSFPVANKNINLLESVKRAFKICNFIQDHIKTIEQSIVPEMQTNYSTNPKSGLRKKGD